MESANFWVSSAHIARVEHSSVGPGLITILMATRLVPAPTVSKQVGCPENTLMSKFEFPRFGRGIVVSTGYNLPIGTKRETKDGYVYIKTEAGWKAEHAVIMEMMIERKLRPGETVHHKNLIRNDNSTDNLELWVSAHPAGARATDLICPHCGKRYASS